MKLIPKVCSYKKYSMSLMTNILCKSIYIKIMEKGFIPHNTTSKNRLSMVTNILCKKQWKRVFIAHDTTSTWAKFILRFLALLHLDDYIKPWIINLSFHGVFLNPSFHGGGGGVESIPPPHIYISKTDR